MTHALYPKLALTGIRKNRRLYLPYLLSCVGMVMMFFILHSLSFSPLLHRMRGGSSVEVVLTLGKFVIAVFSLIFLFYTNSFLIRRRYKEFGLYNILGMDKRAISRVILWESLITALVGLGGGMALGLILSKLAELGLLNAIHADIGYEVTLPWGACGLTALIYGIIFALLCVKSLITVRKCRPLELLHADRTGEKPPRANWALAVLGAVLLVAAYIIAVTIKSPLAALVTFFAAVIMVIIATYLLFISGSVALCRLLQKNKNFYYKKQHFVSVSSMTYRMKRNGAGLASICILCTMVLVMISSTSSLYFGEEDALKARFPRDSELAVSVYDIDDLTVDRADELRAAFGQVFADHGFTPENVTSYRFASVAGLDRDGVFDLDAGLENVNSLLPDYKKLRMLVFVTQDEYNAATGENLSLAADETVMHTVRCTYRQDMLEAGGMKLRVVGHTDDFIEISGVDTLPTSSILMVVRDFEVLRPLNGLMTASGELMLEMRYEFSYDAGVSDEASAIMEEQRSVISGIMRAEELKGHGYGYTSSCLADERDDFYVTYGGLFFLGIMLSIVFIFAAVMIIYYKQISEGYEDRARFAIMRKVGMTREDIRASINAQVLTVFFAPLIMAGLHLAFAFPLVWKILQLFNMHDLTVVILTTVAAFLLFALVYALIYRATARAYYRIVSSNEPD